VQWRRHRQWKELPRRMEVKAHERPQPWSLGGDLKTAAPGAQPSTLRFQIPMPCASSSQPDSKLRHASRRLGWAMTGDGAAARASASNSPVGRPCRGSRRPPRPASARGCPRSLYSIPGTSSAPWCSPRRRRRRSAPSAHRRTCGRARTSTPRRSLAAGTFERGPRAPEEAVDAEPDRRLAGVQLAGRLAHTVET
jgi:hypothetical protein